MTKEFLKSYVLIGLFALASLIVSSSFAYAEELIAVDKALKKMYHKSIDINKQTYSLSEQQILNIEQEANLSFGSQHARDVIVFILTQDGEVVGYALEDTVIGKWGPIHYLVGIDNSGKIIDTIILGFYEIRGRPVKKKRFLKQYRGKRVSDPVRLRKDIDGVSGATITSRSLTDGVRKNLFIFEAIKGEL